MDQSKMPTFDHVRCGTCREVIPDANLDKQPLGTDRLSVFCGRCQRFLFVYDPKQQKELKEMFETRKRLEANNERRQETDTRVRKEIPPAGEGV